MNITLDGQFLTICHGNAEFNIHLHFPVFFRYFASCWWCKIWTSTQESSRRGIWNYRNYIYTERNICFYLNSGIVIIISVAMNSLNDFVIQVIYLCEKGRYYAALASLCISYVGLVFRIVLEMGNAMFDMENYSLSIEVICRPHKQA